MFIVFSIHLKGTIVQQLSSVQPIRAESESDLHVTVLFIYILVIFRGHNGNLLYNSNYV